MGSHAGRGGRWGGAGEAGGRRVLFFYFFFFVVFIFFPLLNGGCAAFTSLGPHASATAPPLFPSSRDKSYFRSEEAMNCLLFVRHSAQCSPACHAMPRHATP